MTMEYRNTASSSGIGVLGLLGVAFVIMKLLKLGPVADWSWWWVTAPFWGGFALGLLVVALVALWAVLMAWSNR